ncbi:type I polyketide synthase [Saccharopolyspora spinosporotrichia]
MRGEGGAIVVLKTLSRALADGDHVHAVLHGSAVNNDGGGKGLTVPNEAAQREVLLRAYRASGVRPADVQYVEMHGTGTPVGDPIEAAALGAVLGAAVRPHRPLLVGSAKTNVGHLGAAAGMAGLLKVVLSVEHGRLPPSLNYVEANPLIPLAELNLRVNDELGRWPEPERPLAGVSAFSVGGTNCHVVVGGAPKQPSPTRSPDDRAAFRSPTLPLLLSGHDAQALRAQAGRLRDHLDADDRPEATLSDLGHSLAVSRTALRHRSVILSGTRAEFTAGLGALAAGRRTAAQTTCIARRRDRIVFVFPGQGSQWTGMAADLLDTSDVFCATIRGCADELAPHIDWSLEEVLRGAPGAPSLDRVDVVQPALFAVMVGLADVWRSFGVQPSAVLGHSQERSRRRTCRGAFLADAARAVALRSRVIRSIAGQGGMASVELSARELTDLLAHDDRLGIAAVNGARSAVVSGDADAVDALLRRCEADGVRARRVPVDYASHSSHVAAIRDELLAALAPIRPQPSSVPFHSTVTGLEMDTTELDADYWYRNLRESVEFDRTVRSLADHDGFIEISPHPVLTMGLQQTLEEMESNAVVLGSLRRNESGPNRILTSMAELHTSGGSIDWRPVYPPDASVVDLPTYAFQRRSYWLTPAASPTTADAGGDPVAAQDDAGEQTHPDTAAVSGYDLMDLVRSEAAVVLGHGSAAEIDPATSFKGLGFDSVLAVELRNRLVAATGLRLPTTLLYDRPSPRQLVSFLEAEMSGAGSAPARATGAQAGEPVAIVSMACRFPGGVTTPEELWQLVLAGDDALTGFPGNRGWRLDTVLADEPGSPKGTYCHEGGFLHDADQFDAEFFGISPREAASMDPQQRMLLETTWEAIERAGIDLATLRGSRTGTYVGAMAQDYGPRLYEGDDKSAGYLLTGNSPSVISGRVAYTFGLEGPAVTVDTACSSSLVALHLAVEALRHGECELALAGGVTVMSNPGIFVEFGRQRGLSPDGRCKAFADGADGTGWAEGAGVLLLERLSDARRNGHEVLAVVRGSAVNQDGASNGLTAPNGPSQERVIRQALAVSEISAADVDAVEAHGTGTRLGDPIEAHALLATYGKDRDSAHPLYLGSLKSNIGHAQAAAGVGGVIKMVQAMRHGVLPRTLHVEEPTSHVDWSSGAVSLLTDTVPWPDRGRPRRAGVSSFGISGTNAHVILEQHPAEPEERTSTAVDVPEAPWLLSARTDIALAEQARRLGAALTEHPDHRAGDVGFTLASAPTRFARTAAVVAQGRQARLRALSALAAGEPSADVVHGLTDGAAGTRTAFLFTGQGSQRLGMGRELYETCRPFAEAFDAVRARIDPRLPHPLKDVLFGESDRADLLDQTVFAQAALFAVETALFRLFEHCGLTPDYVMGHSVGELAAAHAAGVLTLDDACTLVAARGRLMQAAPGGGVMIAFEAGEAEMREAVAAYEGRLDLAAVNGPASVVVSGDQSSALELARSWREMDRKVTQLKVSHAFHSAHMDGVLEEFGQVAASLSYAAPRIPLISNVTGEVVSREELASHGYWTRQLRGTVRFADGVRTLQDGNVTTYLELGPGPVVAAMARACLDETDAGSAKAVAVLRKNHPEAHGFAAALGTAASQGAVLDTERLFPGARRISLPTYPFQRRRYWLGTQVGTADAAGSDSRPSTTRCSAA